MAIVNCWYCPRSIHRPEDSEKLLQWSWISMGFWHAHYQRVTQVYFCSEEHGDRWVTDEMPRLLALTVVNQPADAQGATLGATSSGLFGLASGQVVAAGGTGVGGLSAAGKCTNCRGDSNSIGMRASYKSYQGPGWYLCGVDCLKDFHPLLKIIPLYNTMLVERKKLHRLERVRRGI